MKRFAAIAAALMIFAACDDDNPAGPSTSGPIIFTVQLSASNEVPPIMNAEANGRGNATITFNVPRDSSGNVTGGGAVNFQALLSGFPAGSVARGAHIHPGAAGQNGGILVDSRLTAATAVTLTDGTGILTLNDAPITQDQATQIVANPSGFYFNVHTNLNPGGAVRGQLVRAQ
jgi:hypothetical protein